MIAATPSEVRYPAIVLYAQAVRGWTNTQSGFVSSSSSKEIDGMKSLARGWDGDGAEAPTALAIEIASQIAWSFEENQLAFDRIRPSVVGGVGMTLRGDSGRRVYIEVYNSGLVYMMLSGPNEIDPCIAPVRADSSRDHTEIIQAARAYLGR